MENAYSETAMAFTEASSTYDSKISSNFVNVSIRKIELTSLIRHSVGKSSILEIGCGTGDEALKFIMSTGKQIEAIDISTGMVNLARTKMEINGCSAKFSARIMPARDVDMLQRKFDLVYSFNGALNTEPEIGHFFESLDGITNNGAILLFSLRNNFCLGELIILLLTGKEEYFKQRRNKNVYVGVGSKKVLSRYYSFKEVIEMVPARFKLIEKTGLAVVLPPYLADKILNRRVRRLIILLDVILGRLPVSKLMGDETIYVFQKR